LSARLQERSSVPPPDPPAWRAFARAPLVPVALAAAVGLVLDRSLTLPPRAGLLAAGLGVGLWLLTARRALILVAVAGLVAAHHRHQQSPAADDLCHAGGVVHVRGILTDDPVGRFDRTPDPLAPARRRRDAVTLRVQHLLARDGWAPASGQAKLSVERPTDSDVGAAPLRGLVAGDTVEVVGRLTTPGPPNNLGERDYAGWLRDQGIQSELSAGPDAVTRLDRAEWSADGWVFAVRRRASATLAAALPPSEAALAAALLLGDGSALDRAEWDAYARTGVVHALAISGQHLAVLAGFVWLVLRVAGVRRKRGALVVVVLVAGYTVVTGLRPSGVRAVVMVAAVCGGLLVNRPVRAANSFALGFLAVVALNPADAASLGCRLSFLSVFVLVWGVGRWLTPAPPGPFDQLIDDLRRPAERAARAAGRVVIGAYAVSLAVGLANAPLLAADQNAVSPAGLVIGPPVVVLTSVALIAGFLLLVVGPVEPLPTLVRLSLQGCEAVVHAADAVPGGVLFLPAPPGWWLAGFYLMLAGVVLLDGTWRKRLAILLAAWALVGLLPPAAGPADELRVTVLAVGHGGCAVVETPDGRCLLADCGSTAGPAAVRRVVAPFLWHRGVRRVDELFLSHADSDHFNGVGELLRRFPVGRVTLTPSFADKPTPEVAEALRVLASVPKALATAGHRFAAGGVQLEVLHPPAGRFGGSENERSLVLRLTHAGHTVLLTGDLEKAGTTTLLATPPRPCDVLLAPHHGSRAALPPALLRWADPRLIVASRGPPLGRPLDAGGVPVWATHDVGAVTLRSHPGGLTAEAFRTGERRVVVRGGRPRPKDQATDRP
jgi:competence protein ComEC